MPQSHTYINKRSRVHRRATRTEDLCFKRDPWQLRERTHIYVCVYIIVCRFVGVCGCFQNRPLAIEGVYLFSYVCIYIFVCIYKCNTFICVHVCVSKRESWQLRERTHIYICLYIYMCVYTTVHTFRCVYVCIRV